jgi:microcystin-dependent protein
MSDYYVGEIRMVAFNFAPAPDWLACNGQILQIGEYQALYSLIGITYGGDGKSTFALPDLRSRVPLHIGQGPGVDQNKNPLPAYTLGQKGGSSAINTPLLAHTHNATFTGTAPAQPPSVTVNVQGSSAQANNPDPGGNYLAGSAKIGQGTGNLYVASPAATTLGNLAGVSGSISGASLTPAGTVAVASAGTTPSTTVSIEPPYLAVNFVIACNGVYPSRP